ncbi:DUF3108 domain-containing protein [Caldimonas sp. KR1-144]|uniref:DUF3108 domain-containing protein n=1 Tax=Caldimonas sp. KR1-144 TaxID=3400911 RepID=UPI003C044B7D
MAAARRRRWQFAALAAAVLLVHLWLAERAAEWLEIHESAEALVRMEAAFVRELQPTEPPPVTAVPPQPRPPAHSARPALPASAPEPPEAPASHAAAPLPEPDEAEAAADAASVPDGAASPVAAAEPPASAASDAPLVLGGFAWPPSTQLSYTLTGWVRGEVHGQAQVRWLREGTRYQVQLDVVIGPGFAPVMQRRMTSDGRVTEQGLAPERYDEQTEVAFGRTRRAQVRFEAAEVELANGRRLPALPGVQDTASQFVQLVWLLSTQPQRLAAGASIEMPLALPRRQDRWAYDVVGLETLATPFGPLEAWHLKPRREGDAVTLSIEAWFAPTLQYLPARIVIRQDAETFVDLMIDSLPKQAAPKPPSPPPSAPRSVQ